MYINLGKLNGKFLFARCSHKLGISTFVITEFSCRKSNSVKMKNRIWHNPSTDDGCLQGDRPDDGDSTDL
jgi:hypothetical protein